MKKISFVILCCFAMIFYLSSCTGCKSDRSNVDSTDDLTNAPLMIISAEDSTEVNKLLNDYLSYLKEGNLDNAMSMLYELTSTDSLVMLPEGSRSSSLRKSLEIMSQKDFKIDYIKFHKDLDNEVRIKCILFENEPGENAPNEISHFLRPVRFENHWYLTLADDNNRESEIAK